MSITTNPDWEDDDKIAFAKTSDPRVLAVIERDEYAQISELYDGDAINPIIYVEHSHGLSFDHVAGYDGGEAEAMQRAYAEWGWDTTARRYLWIFHGITAENAWGGYDRSGNWIVATSKAFREHIGADEPANQAEANADCKVLADDLGNALDGDVYGVGYATNEARRLDDDAPINLDDWDIEIQCRGFVGKEYAKSEAATFGHGEPTLPEMLTLEDAA